MSGRNPIVDDERLAAHGQLMSVVHGHLANGQRIPCCDPSSAWAWTEEDPEANEQAATLCLACPALRDCQAYVMAHPEPASVWAATTPKQRRQAERKERTA